MKHRASTGTGTFLFAGALCLLITGPPRDGQAQQPRQSAYYGRTSSVGGTSSTASEPASSRGSARRTRSASRVDQSRAEANPTALDNEPDPLQRYSNASGRGSSLETQMAPPRPQVARPVQRHDYFAGIRNGQSPNRNVPTVGRHHCAPSRGQFLASRR